MCVCVNVRSWRHKNVVALIFRAPVLHDFSLGLVCRSYRSAAGALRDKPPTTLPEGYNVLDVGMEFVEFNDDVRRELRCRRCRTPVPARGWWYCRLESVASPVLKPGSEAEVGLAFRCECEALHVGEPLPTRASTGRAWSLADTVVQYHGTTCPVVETGPSQSLPRGRARDRTAAPMLTPGVTERAASTSGGERAGTGSGARGVGASARSARCVVYI